MELYRTEPQPSGGQPALALKPLGGLDEEAWEAEPSQPQNAWELFRADGHLTDEGLAALIDGTLDEMGRLEASEHLSFCDNCLTRYTGLLTDDILLTPAAPVADSVCRRVRQRNLRVVRGRTVRAVAAAVLALGLWSTGVFTNLVPSRDDPRSPQPVRQPFNASAYVNGLFRSAGDSISSTIDEWLGQVFPAPAEA